MSLNEFNCDHIVHFAFFAFAAFAFASWTYLRFLYSRSAHFRFPKILSLSIASDWPPTRCPPAKTRATVLGFCRRKLPFTLLCACNEWYSNSSVLVLLPVPPSQHARAQSHQDSSRTISARRQVSCTDFAGHSSSNCQIAPKGPRCDTEAKLSLNDKIYRASCVAGGDYKWSENVMLVC